MVRTIVKKVVAKMKVPDVLIREEIEGKPYYYKDYKAVLNKELYCKRDKIVKTDLEVSGQAASLSDRLRLSENANGQRHNSDL